MITASEITATIPAPTINPRIVPLGILIPDTRGLLVSMDAVGVPL
jgi:hypothetical protein